MVEIELMAEKLSEEDNTKYVEMTKEEIWLIKYLMQNYHPKKIVEIGISAGGNTVNLMNWKDDDAQLFSVDIAEKWYKDKTKLSGFMADELENKENYEIYRGYDYLDIYEDIGKDIDFIIIDTAHVMPCEFLTFITALPQLKDGCIVILHDIHLNMKKFKNGKFGDYESSQYCTGLLYGGASSQKKYSLQTNHISNIGAFVLDESTRDNIKDLFRILCSKWYIIPFNLNMQKYREYVNDHYSEECNNLFCNCLDLQINYFAQKRREKKQKMNLNNELKNKDKINESLKKELDSVRKENEMIKSTISWKVTKPLRVLSQFKKKYSKK